MQDYLIRGLSEDISIRIFIATTTQMAEEARKIHNTSPAATTAMGKFLTMAAMMGNNLKSDKDRLTIQIKADGPLGELVAVADGKGNVKAFPGNPEAMAGKNHKVIMEELPDGTQTSSIKSEFSMQALVGKEGTLTVIKDLGLKEPYIGKVPLADGSITGDFMAYFSVSEQTPTLISLGTALDAEGKVLAAGGYMIQVLPGASDTEISTIEKNLGKGIELMDLLQQEKTPEEIAELIMKGLNFKLPVREELRFHCGCTRERMAGVLVSTGVSELEAIISEQGFAEVHCHFCNTKHQFEKEELVEFLEIAKKKTEMQLQ